MNRFTGTVKWAHLPDEIKAVFRECGFRPVRKACHANSQQVLLHAPKELAARLEYREGVVTCNVTGFPIEHGWLVLDGKIVDVTLAGYEPQAYIDTGIGYTQADVVRGMLVAGCWTWLDTQRVWKLCGAECRRRAS